MKKWFKYWPILAIILLEGGSLGQIFTMLYKHTSAGQQLFSWLAWAIGLFGWYVWYKMFTPQEKLAISMTLLASIIDFFGFLTCLYVTYIH